MTKKDRITEILKRSAEKKVGQILEEIRRKIVELRLAAEKEMEREREEKIKMALAELAVERARRIGEADHNYEEKVLEAQHKVARDIEEETERRLARMRENRSLYKEVMERFLKEASQGLEAAKAVVHVNPKDKDLVADIIRSLKKDFSLKEDDSVDFGVIVEDPERGYSVYNTFEFRLRKARIVLLEKLEEIIGEEDENLS